MYCITCTTCKQWYKGNIKVIYICVCVYGGCTSVPRSRWRVSERSCFGSKLAASSVTCRASQCRCHRNITEKNSALQHAHCTYTHIHTTSLTYIHTCCTAATIIALSISELRPVSTTASTSPAMVYCSSSVNKALLLLSCCSSSSSFNVAGEKKIE